MDVYRKVAECIKKCLWKAHGFTRSFLRSVLQHASQNVLGIFRVGKAELNDNRADVGLIGVTKGSPVKRIFGVVRIALFIFLEIHSEGVWERNDD
jgi:hypothetical protein